MEHLNEKRDSWLVWSLFVCLVLALSLSLTGCGKKKKSSGIATTPPATTNDPANPSCTDCGKYTDELAAGLNLAYKTAGINFEMSLVTYAPSSNANNTGAYSGPVYVKGFLKVLNEVTLFAPHGAVCTLKAGDYEVYSKQAGGQFSNANAFELSNIQAEIKHKSSGEKFQLTLQSIEYDQAQQRTFKEGSKSYNYPLSFWGQTYFCGSKSIFFPKGG